MTDNRWRFWASPATARAAALALLVCAGCYVGQVLAFALRFQPPEFTTIWFPGGILLAALLLTPPSLWPVCVLGALAGLLAALVPEVPLHLAILGPVLTVAYRVVLVLVWRRVCPLTLPSPPTDGGEGRVRGVPRFDTFREVGLFLLIAGLIFPALSNLLSAWVAVVSGWKSDFWLVWRTLFLADLLAHVTLPPALVGAVRCATEGGVLDRVGENPARRPIQHRPLRSPSRWRYLEAGALGLGLLAVGGLVFAGPWSAEPALTYASLPLLLWAAVRFGPSGTALALLVTAWLSTWSAVSGHGPFAAQSPADNVLSLQLFLVVMAVPLLFLAALMQERQRTAAALRQSEERYREVVESQTDLVCRYLPDTTLTFVNEAHCRYFGHRREELIGRQFLELIPESAREAARNHVRSLAESPRVVTNEHQVLLADGSIGWQQWVDHALVGPDGRVTEFQAIGRDTTERRRAEEALRQNEAALRASYEQIQDLAGRLIAAQESERTRIARELHDDINQQLAALSIALSSLRRRLPEGAGEVRDELARLQRRAIDLANAIRQLSHELHPGILQHAGLVAALRAHCGELAVQHDIEVTLDTEDDLDDIPAMAALCLYRVAQEALSNIVRHAGARRARVSLARTGELLELAVSDDGQGFDLMEARRAGGLGLLSLDERVRLLGGTVRIDTRPPLTLPSPPSDGGEGRVRGGTELRAQVPLGGLEHAARACAAGR